MPQLKAITMKYKSYKHNYIISNDSCVYNHVYYVQGYYSKNIRQGHHVQLPFNKQVFQQSLAGQAMNNQYHCKPISKPPPGSQVWTG
jgi:hypothetical protein